MKLPRIVQSEAIFCLFVAAILFLARPVSASANPSIALPGAPPLPARLQEKLWAAWVEAGQPLHSRHRRGDGRPRYLNRLMLEANPYLQLHAQNPVDWYPWGEQALQRAKEEGKPIFLSIGYASCHWCHVMAEESFDDEEVAELLNRSFVCVKVDREERPDVDAAYVAAVQRLTGSAGWPLTVFLTPSGDPFYGGTYFPPEDREGRVGLKRVLRTVEATWKQQREQSVEAATSLRAALVAAHPLPGEAKEEATLRRAAVQLAKLFDAQHGGFGQPPKFPQPHVLQFLLRYGQRSGDQAAVKMATFTLEQMARGGIADLLGGGFHRYATDAAWRVPHFEKMLYDQAGLALAYLEASRLTQSIEGLSTASDIFAYVLRELQLPGGGFAAAQDAQSGGREGAYYLWTREEVLRALGSVEGPWVADFFGLTEATAAPVPLYIPLPPEEFIRRRGMTQQDFIRKIAAARSALLAVRSQRPKPALDGKLVTAWNGWMIAALARGGAQLEQAEYIQAARQAAERILTELYTGGVLFRSWYRGKRSVPGFLDDYAFLAYGLHELYEATGEIRWLREADRLLSEMLQRFDEPASGALRYSGKDADPTVPRVWMLEDAALPAAQSVAAFELLRMGHLLHKRDYWERAEVLLRANGSDVSKAPSAYTFLLQAIDFALGPRAEIVIVGSPEDQDAKALRRAVARAFLPRAVLVAYRPGDAATEQTLPFVKKQTQKNGKPTVYVCQNFTCGFPVTDVPKLLEQLAPLQRPLPTPGTQPQPKPLPQS